MSAPVDADVVGARSRRLAEVAFLSGLSEPHLTLLAGLLEVEDHPAGATPVIAGRPPRGLHIIEAGRLQLVSVGADGVTLVQGGLGPGDSFEELSPLDGQASPLTAEVVGECRLLTLPTDRFRQALHQHPHLNDEVIAGLARVVRAQAGGGTVDISPGTANRVADALLDALAGETPRADGRFEVPRNRIEARLTVTLGHHGPAPDAVLDVLEQAGCIGTVGGMILVSDVALLEREVRGLSVPALLDRAFHDPLTGLSNRAHFELRLTTALGVAAQVAVLMLDLDRFKPVNDTFGHPAGDTVLRRVAERLRGCTRRQDTVARLGGDEFAILVIDPPPGETESLAKRAIVALSQPIAIGSPGTVTIGVSVGIGDVPPGIPAVPADLLRAADAALYDAKEAGRGRHAHRSASTGEPPPTDGAPQLRSR